jgi:hypothetical protein
LRDWRQGVIRCIAIQQAVRYNVGVADSRFLGIDLAWREGDDSLLANETGVAVIDEGGRIVDADWTRGVQHTIDWANSAAGDGDTFMFVDAPLVVRNEKGQRLCETQVGQRYWHWKVSANTTNIHSPRLAGMRFLRLARMSGWRYSDGSRLCAWTASLWVHHGLDRCQVLGLPADPTGDPAATMIVPARPEQRQHSSS